MKGLEVKINDEKTVSVELDGVVTVIVVYHEGKTSITASGHQSVSGDEPSKVMWLDQELIEEDSINITFNGNIEEITPPQTITPISLEDETKRKLRSYYALKKELEAKKLI